MRSNSMQIFPLRRKKFAVVLYVRQEFLTLSEGKFAARRALSGYVDRFQGGEKMIKLENVHKYYGASDNRTEILKGITLDIEDGDFAVILGPSGSGKSTLLNVMSGLERPDSGSVLYGEENIAELSDDKLTAFRRKEIGFIFQQYYLLPNLNVDRNVKMGAALSGHKNYPEIIEALGLSEKRAKLPHELSGGEQQRVSAARALAKKPHTLFLDEPTGALDEETGRSVLDYITKTQSSLHFTIVMVTHNANIAEMANTVIRMNSGNIVAQHRNSARKTAYEIGW